IPMRAALWDTDCEVRLGSSDVHPKGAFQIMKNGNIPVRALAMEKQLRETRFQSINILKMNIKGSEKEEFGRWPWIDTVRTIIIECHDRVRPECRSTVEAAARGFSITERGDVILLLRRDSQSSSTRRVPVTVS